jgi:hypothetical protein
MGGFGSGRRWDKKVVVEDCPGLNAGWLRDDVCRTGGWRWTYPGGGVFSLLYEVDTRESGDAFIRLRYWVGSGTRREWLDYRVRLTATNPHFGGLRWYFACPLVVGGQACGRRVGRLYLPPRCRYFGCRHCYRLTYRSAQEHDSRVDALRRDPEALAAIEDNLEEASLQQIALAVKAFW